MAFYEFTITINGDGQTVEEAWDDAVAAFNSDDDGPPTDEKTAEEAKDFPTEYFVKYVEKT